MNGKRLFIIKTFLTIDCTKTKKPTMDAICRSICLTEKSYRLEKSDLNGSTTV